MAASLLPPVDERPLLTVDEVAAARLGLGRNALYRLIAEGELDSLKVGRRTLLVNAALRQRLGLGGER